MVYHVKLGDYDTKSIYHITLVEPKKESTAEFSSSSSATHSPCFE